MATKYKGKTDLFSFKVPGDLREKIVWAAEELGVSQSDFYIIAVKEAIKKLKQGKALIMPKAFQDIPTEDRKMVSIRVPPKLIPLIKAIAPRLFHTTTRFVLLVAAIKAYEVYAASKEPPKKIPKKTKPKKRKKH